MKCELENINQKFNDIFIESDDSGLVEEYISNFHSCENINHSILSKPITVENFEDYFPSCSSSFLNVSQNVILVDHDLSNEKRFDKSISLLTECLSTRRKTEDFFLEEIAQYEVYDYSHDSMAKKIIVTFWDIFDDARPEILVIPDPLATISSFVGLCFLQLYKKGPELLMNMIEFNPKKFEVKILLSQLDGPDGDFPSLNINDKIGKYDFKNLALVKSEKLEEDDVLVNIYSSKGVNHLVCSPQKSLGVILDRIIDKLQLKQYEKDYIYEFKKYNLESKQIEGNYLNRSILLQEMMHLDNLKRIDLGLIRTSSRFIMPSENVQIVYKSEPMYSIDEIHDALQTKHYTAELLFKKIFNARVSIEICNQNIKINRTIMTNKIDIQIPIENVVSIEIDQNEALLPSEIDEPTIKTYYKDLIRKTKVDITYISMGKNKPKIISLVMTRMTAIALNEQLEILINHFKELNKFA